MTAPESLLDGRVVLHVGDSRDVLAGFAAASIDAVVCDPPYALVSIGKRFGKAAAAPAKDYAGTREGATGAYARASAGFMGQAWDTGETAFDPAFWRAVLRVLKPGGHVVAFGGTRSYHHLAMAIETAGFEMRDSIGELFDLVPEVRRFVESLDDAQRDAFLRIADLIGFEGILAWVYGTGFSKSHDVAKGIAKRRTEDVEPVRAVCRFIRSAMDAKHLKSRDLTHHFENCNARLIDHWAARDSDSQPSLPTLDQWFKLVDVLNLAGRERFGIVAAEVVRLNQRKGSHGERWADAEVIGVNEVESPGFGDHRFSGDRTIRALDEGAAAWQGFGTALKPAFEPIVLARKPLEGTVAENVLRYGTGALNIDGCRIHADDAQGGPYTVKRRKPGATLNATGGSWRPDAGGELYHGEMKAGRLPTNLTHDGSGAVMAAFPGGSISAARFFYSAKADADDRLGSGHPTIKPVDLMRWLVRLVTPPGGLVLDPFAGSGTTGEAAFREGCRAVLVEREEKYAADIRRRMALVTEGPTTRKAAAAKAKTERRGGAVDAGPLFGAASGETGEAAE